MKNGLFKKWLAAALCVLALGSTAALAEPDTFGLGTGRDDALTVNTTTVPTSTVTINSYARVHAKATAGSQTLTVDSVSCASMTGVPCFEKAGELVMVFQATGYTLARDPGDGSTVALDPTPVGRWELARMANPLSGGTLELTAPLVNTYDPDVTQVIRVPEFTTVTVGTARSITAPAWNGNTGGVIAFLATGAVSITGSGSINATKLGFRGGQYGDDETGALSCSDPNEPVYTGAWRGEGVIPSRYGAASSGLANMANGGGGGVCSKSGGGGGGNAGPGGLGGNSDTNDGNRPVGGMGGAPVDASLLLRLTFGGGGGAGHGDSGTGQNGGQGGGIVFIRADSLSTASTNALQANGETVNPATSDAGSGGGAGGTLYLRFAAAAACGTSSLGARGGIGGNAGALLGPGGGGGGGRILFQSASGTCSPTPSHVGGAQSGTQSDISSSSSHGAQSGQNGLTLKPSGGFPTSLPVPTVTTPADGAVINNPQPDIKGSAKASTTVVIYIDGREVDRAISNSAGAYTLSLPTALSDGSHTVEAAIEVDGVQSPKSTLNTFTVDTVKPVAPVVLTPADTAVLNTGRPTVTGTAEKNSTVTVYIDGTAVGTVKADGSGNWSYAYTPSANLSEGEHKVKATSTDAAGNTSVDSNVNTFTVDTIKPVAPTVTAPAEGTHFKITQPAITGTAEKDSTVTVILNGTAVGTVKADASGNWSYTPATPLPDGDYAVKATSTDAAGNVSPESNVRDFTVDTLPPPAPVVDTPTSGSVLNNPRPAITGTAEKNSTLTLTLEGPSGISMVVFPVDGSGTWSYTLGADLLDGSYTVKATSTDAAGNTSVYSNTNTFIIDTVKPVAPTVTAPAEGTHFKITQPVITGTAEPDSTVTVILNGSAVGTVKADASGNWSYTPPTPLPDGDYAVKATSTDTAGNVSPESNVRDFTVDTLPPPAPVVQLPANGSVVNTSQPVISGTAEKNSTVTVYIGGALAGTTTADGSGNWSYTPTTPLPEGVNKVKATSTDAAGNTSVDSNTNTFTVDTVKPVAPTVDAPGEGALLMTATPLITGTAEKDSTVTVIIDGKVVATVKADGSGNWSYTPTTPLAEGNHQVKATSTDAAGNTSPESNVRHFSVDTTAPVAPTVTVPLEGAHVPTHTPVLAGTAEPDSTVTVYIDGVAVGTVKADASGNWSFTPATPLPDGEYQVKATATDATGNTGPESNVRTFFVDTTAPVAPTVTAPGEGEHLKASPAAITGSAEPDSTVTVTLDGVVVGTVKADASGNWSYTPATPLADGNHEVKATATDAAGNTGPSSDVRHFSVDTGAPDTSFAATPPSLTSSSSATFDFSSNETGVTYECGLDGAAFTSCTDPVTFTALGDGSHTLQVRAVDASGNVDATPVSYTWTVDTTAPAAPAVTGPAATVDTLTPVITGTAEPGSTVTVIIDGVAVGTVKADASGNWSYTPTTPLDVGPHDVVASATDEAGNTSTPSSSHPFTVVQDTKAPETTITSGPSRTTSEHGATFEFNSDEPGVTYECSLDGAAFTACTSPVSVSNLSEGEHTFQVRARDAAGNVDATPASYTWTVSSGTTGGGDVAFLGDGIGCSATGGDSSLVLMGLGTFLALARRRRR